MGADVFKSQTLIRIFSLNMPMDPEYPFFLFLWNLQQPVGTYMRTYP